MLKKHRISFIVTVLLAPAILIQAKSFSNESWLKGLAGNQKISEVSIPGTHDTGALYEPINNVAKCQDLTIEEQLKMGVRYLDIRCRHIGDRFTIHHGPIYQHLNFNDVLETCEQFLKQHPSEFIMMSVKEEYKCEDITRSFEETFKAYLEEYSSLWYLENKLPTIDEVRGKIILVRRFEASEAWGIDASSWEENTSFTIEASNLKIQDAYKVCDLNLKWQAIEGLYKEASESQGEDLYLNYTSGYEPLLSIPRIKNVSNVINPKVKQYFKEHTSGHYGVSVMDFIDEEVATEIIATNYNK